MARHHRKKKVKSRGGNLNNNSNDVSSSSSRLDLQTVENLHITINNDRHRAEPAIVNKPLHENREDENRNFEIQVPSDGTRKSLRQDSHSGDELDLNADDDENEFDIISEESVNTINEIVNKPSEDDESDKDECEEDNADDLDVHDVGSCTFGDDLNLGGNISPVVFAQAVPSSDEEEEDLVEVEEPAPPGVEQGEVENSKKLLPPAEIVKEKLLAHQKHIKYMLRESHFYIIKSNNHENVLLAKDRSVWSTPQYNEDKLNKSFNSCRNVILIFSVKESGEFQGFARLKSTSCRGGPHIPWRLPPGMNARSLGGVFPLDWLCRKKLLFTQTSELRNSFNSNKPVKIGRDGQEVEAGVARQLCLKFPHDESINLQKIIQETRKLHQQNPPKYEPHQPTGDMFNRRRRHLPQNVSPSSHNAYSQQQSRGNGHYTYSNVGNTRPRGYTSRADGFPQRYNVQMPLQPPPTRHHQQVASTVAIADNIDHHHHHRSSGNEMPAASRLSSSVVSKSQSSSKHHRRSDDGSDDYNMDDHHRRQQPHHNSNKRSQNNSENMGSGVADEEHKKLCDSFIQQCSK